MVLAKNTLYTGAFQALVAVMEKEGLLPHQLIFSPDTRALLGGRHLSQSTILGLP